MIIFLGTGAPPIAYSTRFEFTVPEYVGDDAGKEVWHYVLAKVYVPPSLSGDHFYFVASADDSVQNVKLNGVSKAGSGSSVSINLGTVSSRYYHLLEFEFVDVGGGGSLYFHVATAIDEFASLSRLRVYVPDYGDTEYEYMVTTTTWCSMKDDYFLLGSADDFIEDVCVDGVVWQDWEWNCSPYDTIYAWGDGFCYPLGNLDNNVGLNAYNISFKFGEIFCSGLLDFQYVSWTKQRGRIGPPRFRAVGNLIKAANINIYNAKFYGGSKWKDDDDPQFSERYFEARQIARAIHQDGDCWFSTTFEIGLGLGWAEWALLPATMDDVGVTINLTSRAFDSNKEVGLVGATMLWWELSLRDYTLDIYSFPNLEVKGLEFSDEGESIVTQELEALDYTGDVIMFVSTALGGPTLEGAVGASVGLAIKGIVAGVNYYEGQEVCRCEETISGNHHRQLCFADRLYAIADDGGLFEPKSSESDVAFFKLNPAAGKHCGLTKIVLNGTLVATYNELHAPGEPERFDYPVAEIEISTCIPWFLRG